MNTISRTLALLKPADLFPAWKWIDMMEECGEIEARRGAAMERGNLQADAAVGAGAGGEL